MLKTPRSETFNEVLALMSLLDAEVFERLSTSPGPERHLNGNIRIS